MNELGFQWVLALITLIKSDVNTPISEEDDISYRNACLDCAKWLLHQAEGCAFRSVVEGCSTHSAFATVNWQKSVLTILQHVNSNTAEDNKSRIIFAARIITARDKTTGLSLNTTIALKLIFDLLKSLKYRLYQEPQLMQLIEATSTVTDMDFVDRELELLKQIGSTLRVR